MVFSNNLLMGAGGQATGYEIEQSCKFALEDDPTLTRTFATPTNRRIYTLSAWVKTCDQLGGSILEHNTTSGVTWANITIGNRVDFFDYSSGSARIDLRTNALFHDHSAWYHLVVGVDTTQSTDTNRVKIYVNGVQQTSFGTATYPSQNFDGHLNSAVAHLIGDGTNGKLNGYLAENHFIDGQQLTPASFGETNSQGVWVPIEYTGGSYGNNGYYLAFQDSSSLGDDTSGEGHDWTANNLAAADQVSDTPTNNSSIFNPSASCNVSGQALTISDGNLRTSAGGTANAIEAVTQIAPTSGKYYAEFTLNAAPQLSNQYPAIGIIGVDLNITGGNNLGGSTFFGYLPSGVKKNDNSDTSYGDSFGNGDVIGIAMDLDNQKIYFSKNGTYQNSGDPAAGSNAAFTNLVAGTEYRFCISHAGSTATDVTGNFGASAFATAAPTGFKALNTSNLPTPTISDGSKYFDIKLWTGNDTDGRAITGYNFSPDWVWIKSRSGAYSHNITDTVRGVGNYIQSNTNDAEVDGPGAFGSTLAFTSDGFTLDNGTSDNLFVNAGGETYAGWAWEGNGSGSSNTDGDITSTVSANTTSGFSILTYTGNGSDNQEIGHGIGIAPKMIIAKRRNTSGSNWTTYHDTVGINKVFYLNSTAAASSNTEQYRATPTSSVYTVGVGGDINASGGTYVAYVFAEVEGYSSIGGYTGNGSAADGPFVYTGFRPAWLLVKRVVGGTGNWDMLDTKRDIFNPADAVLDADSNGAEASYATIDFDFLSNGFKVGGTQSNINASGSTYIYMAFAEHPFGGNGIAPVTAR